MHGSVIEVYLSRLVPGRFEACRRPAVQAFDFLERHAAATNCWWLQLNAARAPNEAMLVTFELENMQAWGTATDEFSTSSAGHPIIKVPLRPNSPASAISSGIYETRACRRAPPRRDRAEV
jgi:hypothetical protein